MDVRTHFFLREFQLPNMELKASFSKTFICLQYHIEHDIGEIDKITKHPFQVIPLKQGTKW